MLFIVEDTRALFRSLAEYLEELEAQIPAIKERELGRLEKECEEYEVTDDDYDMAIDELRRDYDYAFPRSLRYSFVVLLFIVIEKQLTEFCKTLQSKRTLPIKVGELKGDIIERTKTYAHKLADIPHTVNWKSVEDLSVVRNCIVHTMGDPKDARDVARIQNVVSAQIGLSLDNDGVSPDTLQLSADYCSKAIQDIQTFFDELFEAAEMDKDESVLEG